MLVTMSQKELDRIPVLQQLCDKRLTQSRAAKLLNLSVRQVQRLLNLYQIEGAAGLSSRKRGKPANNRAPDELIGLRHSSATSTGALPDQPNTPKISTGLYRKRLRNWPISSRGMN